MADAHELVDQVDAVVIAAPTHLHHAVGMEFLRRGVHVLLGKAPGRHRREADDLVAAARRAGVVLQVGHVERFNPAFAALGTPHAPREGARHAERARVQVHRGGAVRPLQLPLDRRWRGAGPDDPRPGPGALAGPLARAADRRPGRRRSSAATRTWPTCGWSFRAAAWPR